MRPAARDRPRPKPESGHPRGPCRDAGQAGRTSRLSGEERRVNLAQAHGLRSAVPLLNLVRIAVLIVVAIVVIPLAARLGPQALFFALSPVIVAVVGTIAIAAIIGVIGVICGVYLAVRTTCRLGRRTLEYAVRR